MIGGWGLYYYNLGQRLGVGVEAVFHTHTHTHILNNWKKQRRGACNAPNNLTCAFKSAHEGRHVNIPVGPCHLLSHARFPYFLSAPNVWSILIWHHGPRSADTTGSLVSARFPGQLRLTFAQSLIPLENVNKLIKRKKKSKKEKKKDEREN